MEGNIYEQEIELDQIKGLIDEKNRQIKELLNPNIFVLNNDVKVLLEEIKELQSKCPHSFKNGYCDYCYLSEQDYKENIK